MRRGAPGGMRYEPGEVPPIGRVALGPRGLGLQPAPAPDGVTLALDPEPLRIGGAAPGAVQQLVVVAGGRLALAASPGVARSLSTPNMHTVHDRRPPGLDRVAGAPLANAGLLHAADGWRAVVLPSLGDLAAGLGAGPVAIRADGRRLAVARNGAIEDLSLPDGDVQSRHEGTAALLGLYEGGIHMTDGSDGAIALVVSADGSRAATLHEDGTVWVWSTGTPERFTWTSPVAGAADLQLSADGHHVALSSGAAEPAIAALVRAEDGALVRLVHGARAMSPSPAGDAIAVGGDWGCAWLSRPVEAR